MQVIIEKDDNDTRLDRWLYKNKLVNSVVESQKLIRAGKIKVNKEKVKINSRVFTGDVVDYVKVSINIIEKKKYEITKKDEDILFNSIIYKDENIIAINKPSGLSVQGGSGSFKNLDSMLDVLKFESNIRPKLVHRLDKHTSGVLLIARNNQTAKKLLEYFKNKQIKKTYLAWVVGIPSQKEGKIKAPIMKKTGDNEKVIVSSKGKEAITEYKVIKTFNKEASLLELYPETGRMHQIRVHLNYIGHPIIGDGKYGGRKVYLKEFEESMHLHALKIILPNPENDCKVITIEAEEPDYFKK